MITEATNNSFQIGWKNPSEGGVDGFEVTVSTTSNFLTHIDLYNNRYVDGNSLVIQNEDATVFSPNTTYFYRIRTVFDDQTSDWLAGSSGVTTKPDNASLAVELGYVCLDNSYTLTPTGPSPGNGTEQHKFTVYKTEFDEDAINEVASLSITLTPDDYEEGTTDFWVVAVSNKSGLQSDTRTKFTLSTANSSAIVFVSDDIDENTSGWQVTHFDNLNEALDVACIAATINISNYTHTGNIDMTGYNYKVGDSDFFLNGEISGGLIQTIGTGRLIQSAVQNQTRTFPVTDGTNNYTVSITPGSKDGFFAVRLNANKSVAGSLVNPFVFWDLYASSNIDATVILIIEKSSLGITEIPRNFLLRFWNGERYVPISQSKVSLNNFDEFYEITINEFSNFNVLD
ncbi:MAG: fibronectin type III domain-containing protein [Candidatus Kapabacteria bacterium]|nr:fibronectin type III domain-containing protein [Ignavibacteriota bacterium]MCW5884824.1 fibronectin type III domain-containing protein [Candidatus Kapabacteria bacterium]